MCLLKVSHLRKSYREAGEELLVLRDVNLTVNSGEMVAITGESGSGKSTLLHLLGMLDSPDSGEIYYSGKPVKVSDKNINIFRNRTIGFVFQFHYLLQGFSALENVMMPGLIAINQKSRHKNKKKVEKSAQNMLERVGLSSRISHRVEELSGGEQQRVALARALVMKPAILLADEPTGNLDRANSESMHYLIDELNKELGMTVIVVTHNNRLARMMKRNVTIKEGKIIPA